MSNEIYVVVEKIDVDGGFGDAIPTEEIVGFFFSEEAAKKYVKEHSDPHIYDSPYSDLYCGELRYRTVKELGAAEEDEFDPDTPVFCDDVTGTLGEWFDRDTSEIPVEALKHLAKAYEICAKEL